MIALLAPLLLSALLSAPQGPAGDTASALLTLAEAGKAAEAWTRWSELPRSADRSRAGVLLAAATGDVSRGIAAYDELLEQTKQDEPPLLRMLAVAASVPLTQPTLAEDVRTEACGIAMRADRAADRCQPLLDAIWGTPDVAAQAVAVYRLAHAGLRPWPQFFPTYAEQLPGALRVEIVTRFTRLTTAERLDLLRPVFERDEYMSSRAAAAAALGDFPDSETTSLLRQLLRTPQPYEIQIALKIALARHGDPAAAADVQQLRSEVSGRRAVDAGVALALAGSPYGPDPARLLETSTPETRGRLAVMLARAQPDLAKHTVRTLMDDPSSDVRISALRAAGQLGMGLERAVYARVGDANPGVRLAAVNAVLQTLGD
ncbi:MAG: hypothetical protein IT184_07980 [Acidobacteria bacterium]|nr:hypothetical protein [Acidobacteriota bacterium]